MRCQKCGGEFDGVGPECSKCAGGEPEVKVLSPDERDDFHGVTIQQGNEKETGPDYPQWPADSSHEPYSEGPGPRVYVKQVFFGSRSSGLLTKLVFAAVVLFLLFVALPLALIVMVVSSVLWWLFKR